MALLTLFLLRVAFGLAFGMALTSPRLVSSGYYRNHLYVILGLAALAALLSKAAAPEAFGYSAATAAASYVGAVAWLYEKPGLGRRTLLLVAALALIGALGAARHIIEAREEAGFLDQYVPSAVAGEREISAAKGDQMISRATQAGRVAGYLQVAVNVTSGLLLGTTLAAMLLGHWYLNSPGMKLEPLRKLLVAMGIAAVLQAALCGAGLALELAAREPAASWGLFIALRWMFGLIGVAVLIIMAWKTLAIPNTQAATGILYVAVIGVFVGETMSLLLSAETLYPV